MRPELIAKDLHNMANNLEQFSAKRPYGEEGAFVAEFDDYPFDSLALLWCDGFGPVRPWKNGDPLPQPEE